MLWGDSTTPFEVPGLVWYCWVNHELTCKSTRLVAPQLVLPAYRSNHRESVLQLFISLHTWAAFHSITGHCVSLSKNCLFISFAHFSLELFVFFLYHLCESFAIVVLWALHFHCYMIASASAFAQSVFLFLVCDVCVLCENHKFLWSIYSKFF